MRDIVDEVGVAKGTFYYYFDSKQAILEALVAELSAQKRTFFQAIVADETPNAIQKWTRALQVSGGWRIERKDELLALAQNARKDENVLLSQSVWINCIRADKLHPLAVATKVMGFLAPYLGLCSVKPHISGQKLLCPKSNFRIPSLDKPSELEYNLKWL